MDVELTAGPAGYEGWLVVEGERYEITAQKGPRGLQGTFRLEGHYYEFTGRLSKAGLTLGSLRPSVLPEPHVHLGGRARTNRPMAFWHGGSALRKQYYFRPSDRGLLAWDVDRLVALSLELPRKHVPLSALRELDEGVEDKHVTWRAVVEHMRLIQEADLAFPIILSATGEVMDGRHRVAKAALEGRETVEAVQFDEDPSPDYEGVEPDDLPY